MSKLINVVYLTIMLLVIYIMYGIDSLFDTILLLGLY